MTPTTGVVLAGLLATAAIGLARRPSPAARLARAGARSSTVRARASTRDGRVARVRAVVSPAREPSMQPLVEAWAARLRAGRAVDAALRDALDDEPSAAAALPRTSAALAVGAELDAAMRADADAARDDATRTALVAVAACWSVAQRNGARLADALDRVAEGVRADETHRAHVRAQLAGPRATARLLAALPLLALAMSSGLGLGAFDALLSGTVGPCALAAGLVLDVLGLLWTARLARRAERDA